MTTLLTKQDLHQHPPQHLAWAQHDHVDDDVAADPLTSVYFELNNDRRSIQLLEAAASDYCDEIYTLKRKVHDLTASVHELQHSELERDIVDALT